MRSRRKSLPSYEFAYQDGRRVERRCSIKDLPEITWSMESLGFRRVFSVPNVIVVPGYAEAVVESTKLKEELERTGKDATL